MKKRIIITLAIFVAAALIGTAVFFTVKNAAAQNASNKTEKKISQNVKEEEHISSAVEFFSRPDVIIPVSKIPEYKGTGSNRVITLKGRQYYFGYTQNAVDGLNAMLILTEEESRELLTAPDIGEISYFQSECLQKMLRWNRVYTDYYPADPAKNMLDVRNTTYYYFDDRTVIVVCGCELCPVNMTQARITVITDAEKESCPFLIPAENGEKEPEGTYYQSYRDYVVSFYKDYGDFYSQEVLGVSEKPE